VKIPPKKARAAEELEELAVDVTGQLPAAELGVVLSEVVLVLLSMVLVLVSVVLLSFVLVLVVSGRVGMLVLVVLVLFWLVLIELSLLVEAALGSDLGLTLSSMLVLVLLSGLAGLVLMELSVLGLASGSVLTGMVLFVLAESVLDIVELVFGLMSRLAGSALLELVLELVLSVVVLAPFLVSGSAWSIFPVGALGSGLAASVLLVFSEDAVAEKNKTRRTKTTIVTSCVPPKSDLTMFSLSLSVLQLQVLGGPTISPCCMYPRLEPQKNTGNFEVLELLIC